MSTGINVRQEGEARPETGGELVHGKKQTSKFNGDWLTFLNKLKWELVHIQLANTLIHCHSLSLI